MRILSLGFALPGVSLDNYSFASAPSFSDYDAIVVDPSALSGLIDDIARGTKAHFLRSGERVVDSPQSSDEVSLAALLGQRREETARLLANGGMVVCLAYPNVIQGTFDRYGWLPAPDGTCYGEPFLRRATGDEIESEQDAHAFAPLIAAWRGKLAYQAHFDGGSQSVIARSAGGAPVAVELSVGEGSVVFLPPPARPLAGDQRYAFSEALQVAIRQALLRADRSAPPSWVATYADPGVLGAPEPVQEGLEGPPKGLNRLLWQEGRHGLEEPVRAALRYLGFRVTPDDIDQPAQVQLGKDAALLEVAGGTGAVGMEAHYPLRQRMEEAIARGRAKHGLLVINGYRTLEPSQRGAQYTEPLRIAAETMRYCIVTSTQLHEATVAKGAEHGRGMCERMLATEGVLPSE